MSGALRGVGGACVSAAPDGSISYATGEALRLRARYFSHPPKALLPARLRHWLLKPAAASAAAGPLILEREEAQLRVTLASRERDGTCHILLEEKQNATAIERLLALGLTPREADVLVWVARGKATGEIAVILEIKAATVSKHLEHIYQKLGVENRTPRQLT